MTIPCLMRFVGWTFREAEVRLAEHSDACWRRRLARGRYNDCATLRPLVSAAREFTLVGFVLAAAEFDTERNHLHIREVVGAESIIPAKGGKASWNIKGVRALMRRRFPRRCHSQRA